MPDRGVEDIFVNDKTFHNAFISSLIFSGASDYLAVIFGGSLYIKFDDIFPSNKSYFLMASDTKWTLKCFQERTMALHQGILLKM